MNSLFYYIFLIGFSIFLAVNAFARKATIKSDKKILLLFTLFVTMYSLVSISATSNIKLISDYISIISNVRLCLLGNCVGVGLSMGVTGVISRLKI
jgi:hypothetical protein